MNMRPARLLLPALLALLGMAPPAQADPRMDYMLHCSGCHRPDGSGAPHSGVPSLVGRMGYFARSAEGRDYLIRVPGTANSPLDHAATARVLNWMMDNFSPAERPADFQPYTEAEIAKVRADWLSNAADVRMKLVAEMKQHGYPVD
ncbi:cytochrome c [Azoarcus sp. TTM-91]|uniref:cytochrome c n=1 Tax=Azoarcus sp. TTM-91 TaxID=2691581 RepID=UPI00145D1F38|nr:cytochrome c [Azoarcus sp. TTM-91]NMG36315.1 cytochrome c [Azoarcus sp. TTM-91]